MQDFSALSVRTLSAGLRQGNIGLDEVVDGVLDARTQNASNPMFIVTVPEKKLRERAEFLKGRSTSDREKMPLFGVPFAVKDNIDVVGYQTTAGCPEYAYALAKNAFIVDRLGSGSAAAVACKTCHFSLGTDTAGSGRIPAGFTSIYGYRPSGGILSNSGVVPSGRMLDSVSVFSRHPDDIRVVMSAAAALDLTDPFSKEVLARRQTFEIPRVGVIEVTGRYFLDDKEAMRVYRLGIERLGELGYSIETIDYEPFKEISDMTYKPEIMAERTAVLGPFIESSSLERIEMPGDRCLSSSASQDRARAADRIGDLVKSERSCASDGADHP